jgi:hypothetical protein
MKLLITKEDDRGRDLGQFEFAYDKAERSRDHLNHLRTLPNGSIAGSTRRIQAGELRANVEAVQHLTDCFYRQMRENMNSRGI